MKIYYICEYSKLRDDEKFINDYDYGTNCISIRRNKNNKNWRRFDGRISFEEMDRKKLVSVVEDV